MSPINHPPTITEFSMHDWHFSSSQGHILFSSGEQCDKFMFQLPDYMPAPPEMTFADNHLKLTRRVKIRDNTDADVLELSFDALSALRQVKETPTVDKVSCANEWKESRKSNDLVNAPILHNFDWTYFTKYPGTLVSSKEMDILKTEEQINMSRLQTKDPIHFYAEVLLFEDELADNGKSSIDAKIRVMPDLFFVLLRHYLRVDEVEIFVRDTRYYHEFDKDYILKETSELRADYKDLKHLGTKVITDSSLIMPYLDKKVCFTEKINF